eukprot:6561142-Pyramimonas_sp.AAC.1
MARPLLPPPVGVPLLQCAVPRAGPPPLAASRGGPSVEMCGPFQWPAPSRRLRGGPSVEMCGPSHRPTPSRPPGASPWSRTGYRFMTRPRPGVGP